MRFFSITNLALTLIVANDALSPERELSDYERDLQGRLSQLSKDFENQKIEMKEALQRSESSLQECNRTGEVTRKTILVDAKVKESEYKANLVELRNQISAQQQELAVRKEKVDALDLKLKQYISKSSIERKSLEDKHADEKAELKQAAEVVRQQLEEKIKNLTISVGKAEAAEGDILFFGSWLQVPKGWHGRVALDLRPLRDIMELPVYRILDLDTLRVPKQYRELYSNGALLLKKVPSSGDLRFHCMSIITMVQDYSTNVVREYSPLLKDVREIIVRTWKVGYFAGKDFYQNKMQPYVENVSNRVSTLYSENEIYQLYVNPLYVMVSDSSLQVYKDSLLPLYTEYILPILENIPQYRTQIEKAVKHLEKDLGVSWRWTKESVRIGKSHLEIKFQLFKHSVAGILVNGRILINKLSAPLVLFGGNVRFDGGALEAAVVSIAAMLVAWYATKLLRVILGLTCFSFCFTCKIGKFLLVTLLLKLIVYTIVWRTIVFAVLTVFYLASFLLKTALFVLKLLVLPFQLVFKLLGCALKLMCCCGLCCRTKSKKEFSFPIEEVQKTQKTKVKATQKTKMKATRHSSTESSTSNSDVDKRKKRKNKKEKRSKNNTSKASEKRRKKLMKNRK